MKHSTRALQAEIAALRERLEVAEQTIDAIRSGKVDALIVSGPEGERVFTLQGADHRYRRIVEGMTEGAAVVSSEGVVLYANSALAALVETPLERVLGSSLQEYFPWASGSIERLLRETRSGTVAVETTLLAEGVAVPVHISATVDREQPSGTICLVVTNLTSAMREAEQRFQFVADMLPQIIWSAHPDGTLDYANRRWFEFTGLTVAQSPGSPWDGVLHADDLPAANAAWRQSVESGAPYEVTCRVHRAFDGAYRWHLVRALPQRGADGAILRWYGTCTDIEDERALSAEAQRARDRAEEATRLKDEFLATLSHELRTPLNAILGWGRMLQAGKLQEPQRVRAMAAIVRNALAQNQLIEDLLDVSRIISGKLRLNVAPVYVNQIIEAAIEVVRLAADAKEVHLQSALDVEAGIVSGDAGRLQQVVWNLLANAVKFTPRGGRIHITLQRHEASAEITVTDSGAGIAREFLPYVFDRFRQQDGAITRRAGGLGLGLAIVKNLVELHGGTVEARSDGANRGATFVVRLPLAARAPLQPRAAPPHDSIDSLAPQEPVPRRLELAGLNVLVVDDEPDARDLLKLILEDCHAHVTAMGSAAEALAAVSSARPDVIVSDIGMPGEDGYSFIRRLRSLPHADGGRTPAVALTAYARTEDRTRALVAGFQSHATKPIDPQELLVIVANLAGRYA